LVLPDPSLTLGALLGATTVREWLPDPSLTLGALRSHDREGVVFQ